MTKTTLFTQYNKTRSDKTLDSARINRALGVAQAKTPRPYVTTTATCTCPDHLYRKIVCKHIIAARFEASATANR